jgi:hypothetical protein
MGFPYTTTIGNSHCLMVVISYVVIVSQQVGLKMNMDKTKIMSNSRVVPTLIEVGNSTLEVIDQYIYQRQIVQLGKSTQHILGPSTAVPQDESL